MTIDVAIVVADGSRPHRATLDAAWPGWDRGRRVVVAADGGASAAAGLGLHIDTVVGDMDSVDAATLEALGRSGTAIERWPRDKDATDTELAVRSALGAVPTRLVILGATGGPRLDHALANVGLLGLAELAGREVTMIDETSRVRLLVGPAEVDLDRRVGDLVSLVPVGLAATGIHTLGLAFPLTGETLLPGSSRGVSNIRTDAKAHVSLDDGRLLVVETIRPQEGRP